jgi:hypothetical protein
MRWTGSARLQRASLAARPDELIFCMVHICQIREGDGYYVLRISIARPCDPAGDQMGGRRRPPCTTAIGNAGA